MKNLIIILLLITSNLKSQNNFTYFSLGIKDELYHYFENLGSKRLLSESDCNCDLQTESSSFIFLNKEDNKFVKKNKNYIDTLLLNDYINDEDINEFMISYLPFLKKKGIVFKDVLITVDIKRCWIRFNIFRFRHKVKYKIIVTFNYNPVENK